jgi:DNA modification methylase
VDYQDFLDSKKLVVSSAGINLDEKELSAYPLFDFQRSLVLWALKKGRCAVFADTGLGKSRIALTWADVLVKKLGIKVLIIAPLAVTYQFETEGRKVGIRVKPIKENADIGDDPIVACNYERFERLDLTQFGAVVLDESSILKSFEGKVRTALIKACRNILYRLCCTATPAPNDISEIANHAEFLGIMTRVEMLAAFFIHDDQGWRLKGHGRKPFYQWLASWGMSVRKPSDLGYSDDGYNLPGLEILSTIVPTEYRPDDRLFAVGLKGISERSQVRKSTLRERVMAATLLIDQQPDEQWLVWVGRNDESDAMAQAFPFAAVVEGNQPPDVKAERLQAFASGETRILITKCSIAGFGLNFQSCARMVFVGLSDSYEQYYQAIRRCYRFGQTRKVEAHIVLSDLETDIYHNVLNKEKEAARMADELIQHVSEFERAEITKGTSNTMVYQTRDVEGRNYHLMLGDSAERLKDVVSNSIGLSVFSEPFASLFTYTNSERDLGNCKSYEEFWEQFSFITRELYRVMMPGRILAAHVQQLPLTKATDGVIGIKDFRGDNIRHFTEQGFIYHGEICIDKDPQAQAIRTKNKGLLFVQLHKDSSWSRPAFADYILLFRKPGDNPVPITPDVSNDEWISWARPIWYGIKESDTLNAAEARSEDDERHICPLQLGTIERCIKLWSNPGETVLTPFAGIGSEVFQAVKLGRKGIGIELNPNYFDVAVKNVKRAEMETNQTDLFAFAGIEVA